MNAARERAERVWISQECLSMPLKTEYVQWHSSTTDIYALSSAKYSCFIVRVVFALRTRSNRLHQMFWPSFKLQDHHNFSYENHKKELIFIHSIERLLLHSCKHQKYWRGDLSAKQTECDHVQRWVEIVSWAHLWLAKHSYFSSSSICVCVCVRE